MGDKVVRDAGIFAVAFILLGILTVFLSGHMVVEAHENAHVQNCLYHNGNVTTKYIGMFDGYVNCSVAGMNAEQYYGQKNIDSIIEAIGYQSTSIYNAIALELIVVFFAQCIFFIFLVYLFRREGASPEKYVAVLEVSKKKENEGDTYV